MAPTCFRVKLEIATSFSMPIPITLDALLSVAVGNALDLDGEATISHIPLEQRGGIFLASSLFISKDYRHIPVGRTMALNGEHDLSDRLFYPKGRKYAYIDPKRGPYKRHLSAYPGIESPEVFFFGVGDPERVEYLLKTFVPGIGKRAAGQIQSVTVTETEKDFSWMDAKGWPARPLPVDVWQSMGGRLGAPTTQLAVRAPYWRTELVECVFPPRNTI
jgi:hypothetical protein